MLEILLKDSRGVPLNALEGKLSRSSKYIKDATHPYVACAIRASADEKLGEGLTLLKYDFINFAAYEGQHFNKTLAPRWRAPTLEPCAIALALRRAAAARCCPHLRTWSVVSTLASQRHGGLCARVGAHLARC